MSKPNLRAIGSFVGPYSAEATSDIVERLMNDPKLEDVLRRHCLGEIDDKEFTFEINLMIEAEYERQINPEAECFDGDWEHA